MPDDTPTIEPPVDEPAPSDQPVEDVAPLEQSDDETAPADLAGDDMRPDQLRKADLVAAVAARTGLRKSDARSAIEAAFAEVGAALEAGRDVSVPELGKLKVNREREVAGAKILICKLRRPKKAES